LGLGVSGQMRVVDIKKGKGWKAGREGEGERRSGLVFWSEGIAKKKVELVVLISALLARCKKVTRFWGKNLGKLRKMYK